MRNQIISLFMSKILHKLQFPAILWQIMAMELIGTQWDWDLLDFCAWFGGVSHCSFFPFLQLYERHTSQLG